MIVALLLLKVPTMIVTCVGLRVATMIVTCVSIQVVFNYTSIVPTFILFPLPVGLVFRVFIDLNAVLQRNRYLRGC